MRYLDLPPVWLCLCLLIAYGVGARAPMDLGRPAEIVSGAFLGAAIALLVLSVMAFAKARTTVIPRQAPQALITSGIFRFTRNPIYLADALILAGLSLRWHAALALVLVPAFVAFIDRRFIVQEEQTLGAAFPETYPAYLRTARRWL